MKALWKPDGWDREINGHFPGGPGRGWDVVGERWWISLLSDSNRQLVSASDQKLKFISHWLEERAISKSSSITKLPLGVWLAKAATISVSLSFMHLEFHPKNEGLGSAGQAQGPCHPQSQQPAARERGLLFGSAGPVSALCVCVNIHSEWRGQKKQTSGHSVGLFVCHIFIFLFLSCFA